MPTRPPIGPDVDAQTGAPTKKTERRRMEYFAKRPLPAVLARFRSGKVLIWSGEHGLWWRANAQGYTSDRARAGLYDFDTALKGVLHCGPEKRIWIERAPLLAALGAVHDAGVSEAVT